MQQLKILLANQNPIVRGSIRVLLELQPEFRVVGEAANGQEVLQLTDFYRPNVLIIDIRMQSKGGLAIARDIVGREQAPAIIFLSTIYSREYVQEAFNVGGLAYVTEHAAQRDLILAIKAVAKGSPFLSSTISSLLIESLAAQYADRNAQLSQREKQIFCFLVEGQDEDGIARSLNCDPETVRVDCERIKQAVEGRTGLPMPIVNLINGVSHVADGH